VIYNLMGGVSLHCTSQS